MTKRGHIILMLATIVIAVVCGFLIPRINVNSDMTKYLPDKSRMKQGVNILTKDFAGNKLEASDVRILFSDLRSDTKRDSISTILEEIEEVQRVSYQVSKDSIYTLYAINVSNEVDQKSFGKAIRNSYGKDLIVETNQDGATPPISALIIAGGLVLFILLIMCQSWMDPLLALLTTGVAVIINIGTNALLPSVSITTNYIVAILQLVLSLDYAIIIMNRFRQEIANGDNGTTNVLTAVNKAQKLSFRPILSSALTTIVGLLMLSFMRLKIGLDLGVVLAKGVVFSLICNFTLMPTLLLLCHKAIIHSTKRTLTINTEKLGRFATNHKVSMAIGFLALFGIAFYLSLRTDIYFSTNGESKIDKIFPKVNPIIVVYDSSDEMSVIDLSNKIETMPAAQKDSTTNYVESILSYPTLLKQQYTAEDLVTYIQNLSQEMGDYMPAMDMSMLNTDMMKMVYYLRSEAADTLHISFADIMQYISEYCLDNPMYADAIDENMRNQIELLQNMLGAEEEEFEENDIILPQTPKATTNITPISQPTTEIALKEEKHITIPASTETTVITKEEVEIIHFMNCFYQYMPCDTIAYLVRLLDPSILNEELVVKQMASLIGSTNTQTKMVYSFSKNGKRMTPLEYVHFLYDDLFNRKALASFVNEEQKSGLKLRMTLMDLANKNGKASFKQIAKWMTAYGLPLTENQVKKIVGYQEPNVIAETNSEKIQNTEIATITPSKDTCSTIAQIQPIESKPTPIVRKKTKAEYQAELFERLMKSDKRYSYSEMSNYFKRLGQELDQDVVRLLYANYGSTKLYNDSLTSSPEQLFTYVADTLINEPTLKTYITQDMKNSITAAKSQINDAISQLRHDDYSIMAVITTLPDESEDSYAFVTSLDTVCSETLSNNYYLVGESVMYSEMEAGFKQEMTLVTLLTILAIFLIVAISFRSIIVPTILVLTVQTAVYVNVVVSGWITGEMLYLAYLIAQSILMGATIDYGILYTNYYRELRGSYSKYEAAQEAYKGSIRTILTSGLIMIAGPGAMAVMVDDVTISAIVGCISAGAFVAVVLILLSLPALLVALDKWVVKGWIKEKINKVKIDKNAEG